MNHRRDRHRLLGLAAILMTLSVSIPASAAISKGGNYTNAAAAEEQRRFLFEQAERCYQKQLQVGRERYEQKQTNRAKIIASMSSELQARQRVVVMDPKAVPVTNTNSDQLLAPVPTSLTGALLIVLAGFGYYLNRLRVGNAQRPKRQPLPEPLPPAAETSPAEDILFCKAAGVSGRGRYSQNGFLVLKGSTGRKKDAPFNATESCWVELFDSGVVRETGGTVIFVKDYLFHSPGMAATALLGRSANGWVEWKTEDGTTLDAAQRLKPKQLL